MCYSARMAKVTYCYVKRAAQSFSASAALLLLTLTAASSRADGPPPGREKITFGAILPLSGNAADQGIWAKNGLDLAIDELNSAQAGPAYEVLYDDSKGDPKNAVTSYTGIRSRKPVPLIFTWGSGVGLALTPVVNRDQVVQIGVATGSPAYRSEGDFTFRTFHSNLDEAAFADKVIDKFSGGGPVAIIKIQNEYGIGYGDHLKKLLEARGRRVGFEDTLQPGETDFRSLLLNLKGTSPQAIMLISYPVEAAQFLAQRRQLGIKAPILASVAILSSRSFFDLAAAGAEDVRVIIPADRGTVKSDAMKRFEESYVRKYGEDIGIFNWYAGRAYDALKVAAAAAAACPGSNGECIRDRLFRVKDYPGAGGRITFDSAGDITTEFSVVVIKDRKFVPEK